MNNKIKDRGLDVLREIFKWSLSRPEWQRDTLRRLLLKGDLNKTDIEELTMHCKASHGLVEKAILNPLEERHIPKRGSDLDAVKLTSLTHHNGVNALAKGQTIEFCSEMTIVYGANAAGKSGYTRILKRACRARGAENILGNVLTELAPIRPSATIHFCKGDDEDCKLSWNDQDETHDALGHVSVFDSHCAAVYLKEKTDVAFRPFGLDLFDRLSDACEEVRKVLEHERRNLKLERVILPNLPEGTAAHQLVLNITSLTNPEEVKKLGTLSDGEKEKLKQVRKRLLDLQAEDPKKTTRLLLLRAQRFETLGKHLANLDIFLANKAIGTIFKARKAAEAARCKVEELRSSTFPTGLLNGTGSELWSDLWESARCFSNESAYPDYSFPVTRKGSRCVLCQQELKDDATKRLMRFEEFLKSSVKQELEKARAEFKEQQQLLENLIVTDQVSQDAVEELRIEEELLAKAVEDCINDAHSIRKQALRALKENKPKPMRLLNYKQHYERVIKEAQTLRVRAEHLVRDKNQSARETLLKGLKELEARENLGRDLKIVIEEIERKKKLAAYELCIQDTSTHAITRKSTEITTLAVTQQLSKTFKNELEKLGFLHLEVELRPVGGTRGTLYHKLILKRAESVDLPRVVSEGEARTLSIAAFFAELSTASDRSAILFDDPVSSLDHEWRDNVARRLAEESKIRQLIIFTHDIVFLLALVRYAEEFDVNCKHQYVKRESQEAGIALPELPWVAMKVKERIGTLKNMWQKAEKLFRTTTRDVYEYEAKRIYGLMREAWERGLEEVLLGGVVERFRPSIQTQQVKNLSDISEEDCKSLETGISKCSRWLLGHDQAPAENVNVPEPIELRKDIKSLEEWIKNLNKRRKK